MQKKSNKTKSNGKHEQTESYKMHDVFLYLFILGVLSTRSAMNNCSLFICYCCYFMLCWCVLGSANNRWNVAICIHSLIHTHKRIISTLLGEPSICCHFIYIHNAQHSDYICFSVAWAPNAFISNWLFRCAVNQCNDDLMGKHSENVDNWVISELVMSKFRGSKI